MGNDRSVLVHKAARRNRYGCHSAHLGTKSKPPPTYSLYCTRRGYQFQRTMETGKYLCQREVISVQSRKPFRGVPGKIHCRFTKTTATGKAIYPRAVSVSYTHLRAHETRHDLV